MSTKILEKKIKDLSREVATLRSLVLTMTQKRDPEGEYKPKFVKEILKIAKQKPTLRYQGRGSLLKQIKQLT